MAELHFTNYDQVLEYIFDQLPLYQKQGPRALKYDLSNISSFMEGLGNPHLEFNSIHIAGTNGKGSTSHFLSAAFQANGYKTGLYTSPHFKDYRERIKINGEYVEKSFVLQFFNNHFDLISEIKPSYFELSVAMAFTYFKERKVDIAIVEVGLGGRLDSTNVITPLLSVITNISYDHMQTLGNTLEEIAGEKAGIIKKAVPVLIGESIPETRNVFLNHAKANGSEIYFSDEMDVQFREFENQPRDPFSIKNIKYAISSLVVFKDHYSDIPVDMTLALNGIREVNKLSSYVGRWQVLGEEPLIVADGAHNLDGWKNIISFLNSQSYTKLHLVLGFVADKSYQEILPLLPQDAQYYFCAANIPRALNAQSLQTDAENFSLSGDHYSSVKNALEAAKKQAGKTDIILVSGSIFVVGEVL